MFSFAFYRRIGQLPALANFRARLQCPSIRPFRAVVTKEIAMQKSRPTSLLSVVQVRKVSSGKEKQFPTFFEVLKVFLIGSGVYFWCAICYVFYTGRRGYQRLIPNEVLFREAAIYQFDPKVFLQQGNVHDKKATAEEVKAKQKALNSLWGKLKSEEDFRRKFGENVNITGFKIQIGIPSNEAATGEVPDSEEEFNNSDTWKASLYVDGSEASGLVTMKFQSVNKEATSWVPVHLQVNTLPNTGVEICHLSSPLPNGLTKFTQLFRGQ